MTPHTVYLDVPDDIFDELTKRADELWFGPRTKQLLFAMLRSGIAGTLPSSCPEMVPADVSKERGYQWKRLFLPQGTMLRQTFQGTAYYARVVGEKIICDEAQTSPSQFANMRGGGNRNAWHAIWLRFPGSADWRLAHRCRRPD